METLAGGAPRPELRTSRGRAMPLGATALPKGATTDVPAATVVNPALPPEERMSFYVPLTLPLSVKGRAPPALHASFRADLPWDAPEHRDAIRHRLTVLLCPAAPATAHVALSSSGSPRPDLSWT